MLGRGGAFVSSRGLGCMGMPASYGATNDEASLRTIERALERCIAFFDTADMDGSFNNEEPLGHVAPAWVLAQGEDVVPIPGTKRVDRLGENIASLDLTLSADRLARIEAVVPKHAARGDRDADMTMVNR